jgi:hypothetical protein
MQWLALAVAALALGTLTTSLLLGDHVASSSSAVTVRIGDATVQPGASETVALEVLGLAHSPLGSTTVDIIYDPDAKMPTGCDANPNDTLDMALCNMNHAVGTIRVSGLSAAGASGDITLANITFQAVGNPGCTALGVSVATLTDPEGEPIEHTTDDGVNCIASPFPVPSYSPTPALGPDDDGDGLRDGVDPCPSDDDCDDDGLMDGSASSEDLNDNGLVDPGETDPMNWDSDGDGLSDGLEKGLAIPEGQDTDTASPHWQPDVDPTTKTDPLNADTDGDGVPDGEEDVNRDGRVDAGETDPGLVAVSLAQGWKHTCYVGEAGPIDQALGVAADKVLAIYRLGENQTWDRWFPGRPDVSTFATLSPYDQVFVLASEAVTWNQQFWGVSQGSVDLSQGWNSVCYSGATKDIETAVAGIGAPVGVIYALQPDQTWARYVPDRPTLSSLTHCARLDSLLVFVTAPAPTQWVFDP